MLRPSEETWLQLENTIEWLCSPACLRGYIERVGQSLLPYLLKVPTTGKVHLMEEREREREREREQTHKQTDR